MSNDQNAQDPLEFVRGMWNQMGFSLPGMVTPTLDVDELVLEAELGSVELVLGQGVEHEGVVGVGAVADPNGARGSSSHAAALLAQMVRTSGFTR